VSVWVSGCVGVCNWYGCWPCGGIGHAWCGSSTARVMFRLLQRPGRRVTWAFDGVTCACECVPRVARSVAWACKRSQCQTRMSPRPGDLDTLICHPALLSATGETDPSGKGRPTGEESLSSVRLPSPGVVVPVACSGVPVLEPLLRRLCPRIPGHCGTRVIHSGNAYWGIRWGTRRWHPTEPTTGDGPSAADVP
jgi:hypothetical protein